MIPFLINDISFVSFCVGANFLIIKCHYITKIDNLISFVSFSDKGTILCNRIGKESTWLKRLPLSE